MSQILSRVGTITCNLTNLELTGTTYNYGAAPRRSSLVPTHSRSLAMDTPDANAELVAEYSNMYVNLLYASAI